LGEAGCALFNYILAFALQLRKTRKNSSQGSRLVLHKSLRRLGRHFRGSMNWPAERQLLVYPPVTSVCSAGQGWAKQGGEVQGRAGQSTAVKSRGQGKTRQGTARTGYGRAGRVGAGQGVGKGTAGQRNERHSRSRQGRAGQRRAGQCRESRAI
jgi:hypothetical protein